MLAVQISSSSSSNFQSSDESQKSFSHPSPCRGGSTLMAIDSHPSAFSQLGSESSTLLTIWEKACPAINVSLTGLIPSLNKSHYDPYFLLIITAYSSSLRGYSLNCSFYQPGQWMDLDNPPPDLISSRGTSRPNHGPFGILPNPLIINSPAIVSLPSAPTTYQPTNLIPINHPRGQVLNQDFSFHNNQTNYADAAGLFLSSSQNLGNPPLGDQGAGPSNLGSTHSFAPPGQLHSLAPPGPNFVALLSVATGGNLSCSVSPQQSSNPGSRGSSSPSSSQLQAPLMISTSTAQLDPTPVGHMADIPSTLAFAIGSNDVPPRRPPQKKNQSTPSSGFKRQLATDTVNDILSLSPPDPSKPDTYFWQHSTSGHYSLNFSKDEFNLFLCMLWKCWNARNASVFRNQDSRPETIEQEAHDYLAFYQAAQDKRGNHTQSTSDRDLLVLEPPPVGFLKLNTDAAISSHQNRTGGGALVRDHTGEIIAATAFNRIGQLHPQAAEGWALLEALKWCQDKGININHVEVDCKNLLTELQSSNENLTSFGNIINAIRRLLSSFPTVTLHHTRRQGNTAAHNLAQVRNEQ
ncbi:hypothetical protein F8388_005484 [Cannabis sativa]|uniref:RNase H type-1 domain-containing protein n=1 Tax=Cannabis sativa TaxID=3483 RepID=A0A7J6GY55_CANSA|nr:hypothetical protein F8388_005484 [Cannabis sativa]